MYRFNVLVCVSLYAVIYLSRASVAVVSPPYYLISVRAEVYILPVLPFDNGDLEPYMERSTVEAHYEGHHEAYRRKMNAALNEWREDEPTNTLTTQPLIRIMRNIDAVPEKFRRKLRVNMGGFVNHAIFWAVLSPNPNGTYRAPTGRLLDEIEQTFGSFFGFKVDFSNAAVDLLGSGYVWLVRNPNAATGSQLSIVTTINQESPIYDGLNPLLVIDVWEHAYYLKHQFRRSEYVNEWWLLINWDAVNELDQFWGKVATMSTDHDEL